MLWWWFSGVFRLKASVLEVLRQAKYVEQTEKKCTEICTSQGEEVTLAGMMAKLGQDENADASRETYNQIREVLHDVLVSI
jgi:hypothetical protein